MKSKRTICCTSGKATYNTYDLAMSVVAVHEDLERAYNCNLCGHWHVTKSLPGEYSQQVAMHMQTTRRPRIDVALACARIASAPK